MAIHDRGPLTFRQTMTPANEAARDAAQRGVFPGPVLPSQQFTIEGGLQQLTSSESAMLQQVVERLKRQGSGAVGAGQAFGRAFGL